MRKKFFTLATIVAVSSSMLFTSCIGSFNLSSKFLAWNQTIDNKFVNAIIFVLLSPAYAVTLLADALVLNTIEFWSGTNPMQAGLIKEVQGSDGLMYTVETLEDGYKIEDYAGKQVFFLYDKETNIWSSVVDGEATKLVKIDNKETAIVYLPNGDEKEVNLSNEGVLAFQQYMDVNTYVASK